MLSARAEAADHESSRQHDETGADASDQIAEPRERGAEREHQGTAETLGQHAGRQLEAGHRAGIERPQCAHFGIAETELRLPQWQEHIEQVGEAVMQRMRSAGDRHCAAFGGRGKPISRAYGYLRHWPIDTYETST